MKELTHSEYVPSFCLSQTTSTSVEGNSLALEQGGSWHSVVRAMCSGYAIDCVHLFRRMASMRAHPFLLMPYRWMR